MAVSLAVGLCVARVVGLALGGLAWALSLSGVYLALKTRPSGRPFLILLLFHLLPPVLVFLPTVIGIMPAAVAGLMATVASAAVVLPIRMLKHRDSPLRETVGRWLAGGLLVLTGGLTAALVGAGSGGRSIASFVSPKIEAAHDVNSLLSAIALGAGAIWLASAAVGALRSGRRRMAALSIVVGLGSLVGAVWVSLW